VQCDFGAVVEFEHDRALQYHLEVMVSEVCIPDPTGPVPQKSG
jgi:hypothetical protein